MLELPPYRLPSLGNMLTHVWQKVRGFLVKAGTLILLMSMVLWLLQSFDFSLRMVDDPTHSMLGALGNVIAPLFAPCGFGGEGEAVEHGQGGHHHLLGVHHFRKNDLV